MINNVFQHLNENRVMELYNELIDKGLSADDAFTEIYAIDCGLDEED